MRPLVRRRTAGALLPLILVLAACRGADDRPADGRRSETATEGDTIVVRDSGEDPLPRRLVVDLRIGEAEGAEAYTFGTVDDVVPAPDGGVYVGDQQSHEARRYDAEGRLVRQVGRRGAGPGEYEYVAGMVVVDEGLAIWDAMARRRPTPCRRRRTRPRRTSSRPAARGSRWAAACRSRRRRSRC